MPKLKGGEDGDEDMGPWIIAVGYELEHFSNDEREILGVPVRMAERSTQKQ